MIVDGSYGRLCKTVRGKKWEQKVLGRFHQNQNETIIKRNEENRTIFVCPFLWKVKSRKNPGSDYFWFLGGYLHLWASGTKIWKIAWKKKKLA